AGVASEIEREQRLVRLERGPNGFDRRWPRIDQVRVAWKQLCDIQVQRLALVAQFAYGGIEGLDSVFISLSGRQGQRVVEGAKLRTHLLAQILLLSNEIGQRFVLNQHSSARLRQRRLYRLTANGIGQRKGFDSDAIVRIARLPASQQRDIGLD